MIEYSQEYAVDYVNYRFAYCRFRELEHLSELDDAYAAGFLPASGEPFPEPLLFYQARSVRVDLRNFSFNKKRRYHQRQLDETGVEFDVMSKAEFRSEAALMEELRGEALEWVKARYPHSYLPPARLEFILERPFLTHVARARHGAHTLGYALICRGTHSVHYWFALYRPQVSSSLSAGKWLMGRFLQWAATQELSYAYLGTLYGSKSAYKIQGINGCSYFNGRGWSTDFSTLQLD
ncbi:MAG: GNAT family N-acetyltransferase [Verrucomicrobia bacterium]|nr:GNAT family N-acetyltransferase [Verrucomicrobiota bacterium]